MTQKKMTRRSYLKYAGAAVVAAAAAGGGYYLLRPAPQEAEKTPILFGGTLDLTDGLAGYNLLCKVGYDVWEKDVNARGGILGRPVKMILYDDELKTEKMLSLSEKLLTVDNVDFLTAGTATLQVPVMAPLGEKYGKVLVALFWPASLIFEVRDDPNVFPHNFGYSAGTYVYPQPLFEWMNSLTGDQRPKKVALVGRDDLYGRDSSETCRELAAKYGFEVILDEFHDPMATDVTALMQKVKSAGPDAVVGNGYGGDAIARARALHSVGFVPKIYWENVGPATGEWIQTLGKQGDYTLASVPWVSNYPGPENETFKNLVKEVSGKEAEYGAAICYMQMQLYEQAIKKAGSLDQEKIREIFNTEEFDLLVGKFKFVNRFGQAPIFLTQVQNGKLETVWPTQYKTKDAIPTIPSNWGQ